MGSVTSWLQSGRPRPDRSSPIPQRSPDAQGRWLVIESELLSGEAILYVRDPEHLKIAREAHPQLISYLAAEIEELYAHRLAPDLIAAVHRIKKKFGGRVRTGKPSGA